MLRWADTGLFDYQEPPLLLTWTHVPATPARRGSPRCAGPRASNARAAMIMGAAHTSARAAIARPGDGGPSCTAASSRVVLPDGDASHRGAGSRTSVFLSSAWLLLRAMAIPARPASSRSPRSFRTKNDPVAGGAGRSHDGKLLASAPSDGNAPGCAWPRRPTASKPSTASSDRRRQPDRRLGRRDPRSPRHRFHGRPPRAALDPSVFSNSRAGRAASITGCAPSTCKAISTSSCSASTGAGHATPPSAHRHRRVHQALHLQHVGPAGSWCISDQIYSPYPLLSMLIYFGHVF